MTYSRVIAYSIVLGLICLIAVLFAPRTILIGSLSPFDLAFMGVAVCFGVAFLTAVTRASHPYS